MALVRNFAGKRDMQLSRWDNRRLSVLQHYIDNQHEHHRVLTFKDELLNLLGKYETEYDQHYLWS